MNMLINQNKKVKIDIGPEKVNMYECTGKVHSVFDFFSSHKNILNDKEVELINSRLSLLKHKEDIPKEINRCLARTPDLKKSDETFLIKRSGARSAYWFEKGLKFKGCRPITNRPATFPMEKLDFDSGKIAYSQIPFGVLTKEAVLREILGFCFFASKNLPVAHEPLCVYEYFNDGETAGFCIVLKTKGETRAEQFIEYPEISLTELIESKRNRNNSNFLIGSELRLKGLNVKHYSDEKARVLARMHFSGAFRGILNSNIGNDVILSRETFKMALCDFDTFQLIKIPQNPDINFLPGFVLLCLIEVLKGSISILDYIHFNDETIPERNELLLDKYKKTSSLWQAYEREFWVNIEELGWNEELVKDAFNNVLNYEALFKILSLVIPNNKAIDDIVANRNIYYSHD